MTANAPAILTSGAAIDLSSRFKSTTTVVASPALAAETTIASLTLARDVTVATGILLIGWAAYTVGTSGVSVQLKLRQTGTSGTTLADSGATTGGVAAAALYSKTIVGIDTAPALPGQVYVLTMTVGSGAAVSTVSSVFLSAIII